MKPTDYKAIRYIVFLLIIVVFSSNKVIGQYDIFKSDKIFNKGQEALDKGDYKKADSLFRLSIKLCPQTATYYKVAITKQFMKDKCGYCDYLDSAILHNNIKAEKLFNKDCIKRDSLFYDSTIVKDFSYYLIIKTNICSQKKSANIYVKYANSDYYFIKETIDNDSILTKVMDKKYMYSSIYSNNDKDKSDIISEEMPEFPGGEQGLREYIANNVKYPEEAKNNKIEGKVFVYFVINENGNAEQIEVKRKVNPLLDAEAVRVIKNMPRWKPGIQRGKAVKVAFTVPINFLLN